MGFFPPDYKPASAEGGEKKTELNPKYWEFNKKHMPESNKISFRMCGDWDSGHVAVGWQYFTMDGRIRRFTKYPKDFASDIGLTFEAKFAKADALEKLKAEGKDKERPKYFMSFVAYFPDRKDFVCVTVTQKKVREQIEAILSMDDYKDPMESGVFNFTVTVQKKGEGTDTTWTVTPTLKKPTPAFEEKWTAAKSGIWLPALFEGADPFAGKPAEAKIEGLPPTKRDELGADKELATAGVGEDW